MRHLLSAFGWSYVCRTAMSTTATWEGEPFRLDTLGACLRPGRLIELQEVYVTREAYGPIMVLCCWAKGYQEPLYLVSNLATAEEACRYYQKRFRIETFFSDQKSRGFHIQQSHIADPQRLSRLLIAACLAYIWIVYLGSLCEKDGWQEIIHRGKRCDLSLFQLGLRLLRAFFKRRVADTCSIPCHHLAEKKCMVVKRAISPNEQSLLKFRHYSCPTLLSIYLIRF